MMVWLSGSLNNIVLHATKRVRGRCGRFRRLEGDRNEELEKMEGVLSGKELGYDGKLEVGMG